MLVFDVVDVWFSSMKAVFDAFDVTTRHERSPANRPNPSCSINLSFNNREADLVIWDSGKAELAIGEVDGVVSQTHFDDLRNREDLSFVLSKLTEFAVLTRVK